MVWRQAESNSLPSLVFIKKMDRDGVDFQSTVESIREYFKSTPT